MIGVFTLGVLGARRLGALQAFHPALRGLDEGCQSVPQPCWYGIRPTVTAASQASALVRQARYPLECVSITADAHNRVADIEMKPCAVLSPLRIGDIIGYFGQSAGLSHQPSQDALVMGYDAVVFDNRYLSVALSSLDWVKYRFEAQVVLKMAAEPITSVDWSWYANVPRWRLCQLEPQYYVCGFCSLLADIEVYDTGGVC